MSYLPVDLEAFYTRAARQVMSHARQHPDLWTQGNVDSETGERYSEPCNPRDKAAPDWWQRCDIFDRNPIPVRYIPQNGRLTGRIPDDVLDELRIEIRAAWREACPSRHTMTLREIREAQGRVKTTSGIDSVE